MRIRVILPVWQRTLTPTEWHSKSSFFHLHLQHYVPAYIFMQHQLPTYLWSASTERDRNEIIHSWKPGRFISQSFEKALKYTGAFYNQGLIKEWELKYFDSTETVLSFARISSLLSHEVLSRCCHHSASPHSHWKQLQNSCEGSTNAVILVAAKDIQTLTGWVCTSQITWEDCPLIPRTGPFSG